jgi:hypothetical protein
MKHKAVDKSGSRSQQRRRMAWGVMARGGAPKTSRHDALTARARALLFPNRGR